MYELIEAQGKLVAKKERNPHTGLMEVVDVRPHPALHVRDRALTLMKSFCSQFGLSPASRARLFVERPDDSDDELMEILSRPRVPRKIDTREMFQ